ncbi:Ead/Ea22-like protein [Citrobacter amalonaticus]|uniref:ead/Ea22-like family protein n=1 Tax=Citrobacter amalonaticus TaxID=35703 RepID=UPI0008F05805|nr:ead/Ea22-like family protein [Citrobacter amalonaticus]SFA95225.1 Ead/Ea22-like protein [Citrobacter amalonaticus]
MSNIDKQALREIAEQTKIAGEAPVMPFEQRINALNDFMKHFTPATVLALLDELEAAEKRIAELREWNAGLAQESCERQQRIIELEQKCENDPHIHEIIDLKERIAELEAREVKLPEAMMPARHNSGELFMSPDNVEYGGYLNRDDVVRALRAAGIITKVGE